MLYIERKIERERNMGKIVVFVDRSGVRVKLIGLD